MVGGAMGLIPITEQVILTIITALFAPALLAMIGIYAVHSKHKAIARRERVEAENKKIAADAAMVMAEAEGKLAREKGDISQIQLVTEMMRQQITINQQLAQQSADDREKWRNELAEKERRDEANYRVLADALRDVGQMMITEVQTTSQRLETNTRSLIHEAMAISQQQYGQRDILKFVAGGTGIPFPREHGYVFRKCKVKVKSGRGVNMFPSPLYMDQKPVGKLFSGDEVWIMIDVPFPQGWAAVRALELGVNGWVDKSLIEIEDCVSEEVSNPT
jgi:hypothetical protein